MFLPRIFSHRKIAKLRLTHSFAELLSNYILLLHASADSALSSEKSVEMEFEKFIGAGYSAVLLPHARIGVQQILKACQFPPGSEVVMTPLTIGDMVNSIHSNGLIPRFADIELATLNFEISSLRANIGPKTRAILITYLAGVVPNLEPILQLAKEHKLFVIEDCSQAVGSRFQEKMVGTFGDAAVFSFTNFKSISSLFGGMVITKNAEIAAALRDFQKEKLVRSDIKLLRAHCAKNIIYSVLFSRYIFSYITYFLLLLLEFIAPRLIYRLYSGNIRVVIGDYKNKLVMQFPERFFKRFTYAQANLALASLTRVKNIINVRTKNGERLWSRLRLLEPSLRIPEVVAGAKSAYWRFPVLCTETDELKRHLLLDGFDSAKTFLTVCSSEPGFEPYHQPTPNAEFFKEHALILEVHEGVSAADIADLGESLERYFLLKRENECRA